MPVGGLDRVTVLIDYENVHRTATRLFLGVGADKGATGHVHPRALAQLIVDKRRRTSMLHEVRVYRGQPSPHLQPVSAAANNRQTNDWQGDGVTVIRRNLMYQDWPEQPPREKGIDVAVAVDAVRLAALKLTDVVVIFSHDKDLLPAVETVMTLPGCHVEVTAWETGPRIRIGSTQTPWCHFLSESEFASVRDRYDYTN